MTDWVHTVVRGHNRGAKVALRFGRMTRYGVEALPLIVGVALSAIANDLTWLLVARFILGPGLGGDYPASGIIASGFVAATAGGSSRTCSRCRASDS